MHKIIRRVISKELSEFCYNYLYTKRKVTKLLFATEYINSEDHTWGRFDDPHVPGTYITYGDIAMETLLTKLHPLIEIETKTKLYPTYGFARLYKKGDVLKRHIDKEIRCKFSTTLNLGGDPWPIFLEPSEEQGKKGIRVLLEPGDMLIYEGPKHEHWREEFKGENCGQVFLHYSSVTEEEEKYDTRPFLGLPPWFIGFKLNDNYDCG